MTKIPVLLMALLLAGVLAAQAPEEEAPEPAEEAVEAVVEESAAEETVAAAETVDASAEEQPADVAEAEESMQIPMVILGILKWVLGATGLTLIAQFLRRWNIPQKIPGFLRPLIGPVLGTAAVALSNLIGFPVDLSIIEGALLGATSGLVFDAGNELGLFTGTSNG